MKFISLNLRMLIDLFKFKLFKINSDLKSKELCGYWIMK